MKYFKIEEFDFRGAPGYPPVKAEGKMNEQFLQMLDDARGIAGVPFKITSGYRPAEYDGNVHGIPNSDHVQGCGADILIDWNNGIETFRILRSLMAVGFKRVGFGINTTHIHIGGLLSTLPQGVVWKE